MPEKRLQTSGFMQDGPSKGFQAGITTRKFYNDLCGAKSTFKRDVLNKCLNLFAERTFYTSRTEHSKKINNGIERHFQPNYCALILRMLFAVFKVSHGILWFFLCYSVVNLTFYAGKGDNL